MTVEVLQSFACIDELSAYAGTDPIPVRAEMKAVAAMATAVLRMSWLI